MIYFNLLLYDKSGSFINNILFYIILILIVIVNILNLSTCKIINQIRNILNILSKDRVIRIVF